MPIVLKPASLHIKDENGNYLPQNVIAEKSSEEYVNKVTTEGNKQLTSIQAKGEEVLDSIPSDYTELQGEVTQLKSALTYQMLPVTPEVVTGKYVRGDTGAESSSASWVCTDYVEIPNAIKNGLIKYKCTFMSYVGCAFYDHDKTFISGISGTSFSLSAQETRDMGSRIPSNAKYFRCTLAASGYSSASDFEIYIQNSFNIDKTNADIMELGEEIDGLYDVKEVFSHIIDDVTEDYDVTVTRTDNLTWTDKYYNLETGEIASASGYTHTPKFPCKAGDTISIGQNTGQVLYWGENGYISYDATSPSQPSQFTAPSGATEYACNNRDSSTRAATVTVSGTVVRKRLIETTYYAPTKPVYTISDFVHKNYAGTANGQLYTGDSYSTWYCAFKVPCKSNHRYMTKTKVQAVFYDENGDFISSYIPTYNNTNNSGTKVEGEFTTPANCIYFSINTNYDNEVVYDSEYTKYGNDRGEYNLLGKTVVCFGDSITGNYWFGDNYPYQIEQKTGAKVYDVGFGGCRMEMTSVSGSLYINPFSMASLADAITSESVDRWSSQETNAETFDSKKIIRARLQILEGIDFSNVDIITIAYGTNGIGSTLDNAENPLDTYTFAGAARYAIKTILTKYPHLRVVLLTPVYKWYSATSDDGDTHEIAGQTLLDRVTKLLSVGEEFKVPTIDLYHTLGINKYNYTAYFGDDDETADGTHLNSFGREQMGLRIAGELNRLF